MSTLTRPLLPPLIKIGMLLLVIQKFWVPYLQLAVILQATALFQTILHLVAQGQLTLMKHIH